MAAIFGPTFGDEVIAAGLGGLPFSWDEKGRIFGRDRLTAAQNSTLDAVILAHVASKPAVALIPLDVFAVRMNAEGAWDTFCNWMFAGPVRRNILVMYALVGQPIRADNGVRTHLANAGISAAAIDRILAPLPPS